MKKLLMSLLIFILFLTGCSSSEVVSTTVCQGKVEGIEDKMSLEAEGDKIITSTEEAILTFIDYNIEDEEERALFIDTVESQFEALSQMEGVSVETEIKDDNVTIRVVFDMSKAAHDTLVAVGFSSDDQLSYISLKETIDKFEAGGFSCTTTTDQ